MFQMPQLKELSFLVYGLGISGNSVIKFFKRNKIKNFQVWDDKKKNIFKNYRATNLKQTLLLILIYFIFLTKNQKVLL